MRHCIEEVIDGDRIVLKSSYPGVLYYYIEQYKIDSGLSRTYKWAFRIYSKNGYDTMGVMGIRSIARALIIAKRAINQEILDKELSRKF